MILSSLHLPPMPIKVQKIDAEDSTVLSDEAVESSHDIIAGLMAFARHDMSIYENNQRQMLQLQLFHEFYEELDGFEDLDSISDETLYAFYAKHSQAWVRAYTIRINHHLASFMPYDYVANGDKIHKQTAEYAKAQCLITSGGKNEVEIEESVGYLSLIRMCAKWAREVIQESEEDSSPKKDRPDPSPDRDLVEDGQ